MTPTVGCWFGGTVTPVPVIVAPGTSPRPITLKVRPSIFRVAAAFPGKLGRNVILKLTLPPGASDAGREGKPSKGKVAPLELMALILVAAVPVFVTWNCTEFVAPTLVGGSGIVPPGDTGVLLVPAVKLNDTFTGLARPVKATVRVTPSPVNVAVPWNAPAVVGAKLMSTDWEAPAARFNDPVDTPKGRGLATAVTFTAVVPGFATVTLRVNVDPTEASPKSSVPGVTVKLAGAWPWPATARATVMRKDEALPVPVRVNVIVPVCGPGDGGLKFTVIACVLPAFTAKEAGLKVNAALLLVAVPLKSIDELLVIVALLAGGVVPTVTLPKSIEVGLIDMSTVTPAP